MNKLLLGLVLSILLIMTLGFIIPVHAPSTNVVIYYWSGNSGYVCFNNLNDTYGNPVCLDDHYNYSAIVPTGNYSFTFYPTLTSNRTFIGFFGVNGVRVGLPLASNPDANYGVGVINPDGSISGNVTIVDDGAVTYDGTLMVLYSTSPSK